MKKAFLVGIALTISLVIVLAGCADNNDNGGGSTCSIVLGDSDNNCTRIGSARGMASHNNTGTITDVTGDSNCNNTASCVNSVYTGTWGGFYYDLSSDINASASDAKISVTYKLQSGGVLRVKLEDSDSTTETDANANMQITDVTPDNTWRTVEISVASTWTNSSANDAGVNLSKIDNIGFWNQGANVNLTIDEVIFR